MRSRQTAQSCVNHHPEGSREEDDFTQVGQKDQGHDGYHRRADTCTHSGGYPRRIAQNLEMQIEACRNQQERYYNASKQFRRASRVALMLHVAKFDHVFGAIAG